MVAEIVVKSCYSVAFEGLEEMVELNLREGIKGFFKGFECL